MITDFSEIFSYTFGNVSKDFGSRGKLFGSDSFCFFPKKNAHQIEIQRRYIAYLGYFADFHRIE